jgi:hypothetical protein
MSLAHAIGKCLNDAQISLATHKKGAKTLCAARASDPETFLPTFCNAILPVLLEYKVRALVEGTRMGGDEGGGDVGRVRARADALAWGGGWETERDAGGRRRRTRGAGGD